MGKVKRGLEERRFARAVATLFTLLLILVPFAWADEGPEGGGEEGIFSRAWGGLAGFASGIPGIFSELSPADVGYKTRIRPHLTATQGFVSNARLGEDQGDPSWQARVAPGIQVAIPSGKLYTEVDYTYGFSTTQGRKTSANINTHNLNLLARYGLTADTTFGLGNNLQFSEVPGEPGEPFILETATAQVKHRLGPKLTATITDTLQFFEDKSSPRSNDFVDNGISLALPYEVTSDFSLGPSFSWNVRDFQEIDGKDYWQIQPLLVTSYRLGSKTTVNGNFGWAFRRFEQAQGQNKTESELVYGASLNHLLGRKLIWSLSYEKRILDTFDTSFVFRDKPESTTLDNLNREFRVVKSHRLMGKATYHFNEQNSVEAFGDFQFINTDAKDQVTHKTDGDEKAMEIGAGYFYRFNRYISFDIVYTFGRRFTAEANPRTREDYTFHRVTGGVNVTV